MRKILFLLCLASSMTSGPQHAAAADAAGRSGRPNFVFIYTDDQRWDAMGVVQREMGEKARFPWFKSPNLDRLAAEGIRFRNAFVVNSLCAPSRATFMTGQYGHRNGIVNNHTPFPADNVTHATALRNAGYKTGYIGKWHMGSQPERPGFDFSASFIGQGVYFDCPILVNGEKTPSKGWVDDVSTDYAIRFIRENKNRPFNLVVGFKAAHGPFDPPERRRKDYEGELARAVPNLSVPAIYNRDKASGARGMWKTDGDGKGVPVNLNYFRCLAAMDDNVGRILDALDELKLADDTVVVFAGDNGFYLGEHQLGDKRSAYDESIRIPLLLRYPRLASKGATEDRLALNIDLAPTILDFAGQPIPPSMQGRSWRPLLEGRATEWRKSFFYCYFLESNFGTPLTTAVRTETAKLIRYPGRDEWTEVFDLARDPYEIRNLAGDATAADLRRLLEAEYKTQSDAIGFHIPDFADKPREPRKPAAPRGVVLDYKFDGGSDTQAKDASGRANHGTIKGGKIVDGRNGRKALQLDGTGFIDIPKSPSLNPADSAWTVEISFQADKPDGILAAHGGQTLGYCLSLEAGKTVLTVNESGAPRRIEIPKPVGADWTTVTVRLVPGAKISLQANDGKVVEKNWKNGIDREPNDNLQIGADLRSPVIGDRKIPNFSGRIEYVRIKAE